MEKLEKWGVVSRPAHALVIGRVLSPSATAEIDRIALGNVGRRALGDIWRRDSDTVL